MSFFSSIFGGSSETKFEVGEALDGSGLPVSLSNTVDDISPDQFWEMAENFVRNRKPNKDMYEMEYTVSDMEDGGILAESFLSSSGVAELFAGKISGRAFQKIYFKQDEGQIITHVYNSEVSEDSHVVSMYLTVHTDPLRFEYYQENMNCRAHGPVLKGMLIEALKKGGYDVTVENSVPSPSEEGKKCVLTSAMPEDTTIEKLFAMHCQQAKDDRGATDLPDGAGVIIEMEFLTVSNFHCICMSDDGTTILHKNFGTDDTMTDLQVTIHEKLVPNPPRVEVFSMQESRRIPAKEAVEPWVKSIFAFAKGEEPPKA